MNRQENQSLFDVAHQESYRRGRSHGPSAIYRLPASAREGPLRLQPLPAPAAWPRRPPLMLLAAADKTIASRDDGFSARSTLTDAPSTTAGVDHRIDFNAGLREIEKPIKRETFSERIYRPLFISPEDAAHPVDRLQIVQASEPADVPSADVEANLLKLDKAIRYLNRSDTARASIDAALRSGAKIDINHDGETYHHPTNDPGNAKYRIVDWDPASQIRLMNDDSTLRNEYQSAALGVGHELHHVSSPDHDPTPVPFYDTKEERRVIMDWEKPVAEELGEPVRTNHYGLPYAAEQPTTIIGGVLDEKHLLERWRNYFRAQPDKAGRLRSDSPLRRR